MVATLVELLLLLGGVPAVRIVAASRLAELEGQAASRVATQKEDPRPSPWFIHKETTCWPGVKQGTCKARTIEGCQQECLADPSCGGFTWPHRHFKSVKCAEARAKVWSFQSLFLKPQSAAAATGLVYVIRHAEKTSHAGCLSERGLERAESISHLFNGKPSTSHETFEKPKVLFANFYGDDKQCERTNQTIQPISKTLGLPVVLRFGGGMPGKGMGGGNTAAANAILEALTRTGGPVLVSWESMNIPYLCHALGANRMQVPSCPPWQFDRIWILKFHHGVLINFRTSWQNFTSAVTKETE